MSERWTWRGVDATGGHPSPVGAAFPTQVDAEAWLGESWEDLIDAGVAAVTLLRDGDEVYGPMALHRG